jgi:hypothetical protein
VQLSSFCSVLPALGLLCLLCHKIIRQPMAVGLSVSPATEWLNWILSHATTLRRILAEVCTSTTAMHEN